MNEKTKAEGLHEATPRARGCDRAEELVTYLYGESAPAAAHEFRRHLDACAVCREELSAFGAVREAVGEWRAEALSVPPSLELHGAFARRAVAPVAAPRERSALAALREFFSLSPLWLKAGACAAAIAFCALSVLTLARSEVRWDANGLAFRTGVLAGSPSVSPVEKNVEPPAPNGYTLEQVEEVVRRRLEVARAEWESKPRPPTSEEVKDGRRKSPPQLQAASAPTTPRRKRVTPRSPRRDQQNFEDEDTLPRLSDLLGDAY